MLLPVLLITTAVAGPYQDLRDQAEAAGRLVPGDTAVLVGLAQELGCVASHDPVDCEAMRVQPPPVEPVIMELVPVPCLVLPALGGRAPALLLPRFPYGLGEPVTPVLGPMDIDGATDAWVRLTLPEGTDLQGGPAEATLLVALDPVGPSVQPFVEPPGSPAMEPLLPRTRAEAWPTQLMAYTRVQVMLPVRPVAVQLTFDSTPPVELGWPELSPAMAGQPLVEPAWGTQAAQRLALATGMCMRAYYAGSLRRPSNEPPVLPVHMAAPRLAVLTDEHGQVLDAIALDHPWGQAEPAACLRANARMLPAAQAGSALSVLPLSLPPAPSGSP
jgi:hypothetical protein